MDADQEPKYPIRTAARKTGLSPHVLRAWERRYNVVEPSRPSGGMRLYSDADILRFRLLKRLTDSGHQIGRVARLSVVEMTGLLEPQDETGEHVGGQTSPPAAVGDAGPHLLEALRALEAMDGRRLHASLMRSVVVLSAGDFLEKLVIPLLRETGELWASGRICPAHEHVLSVQVSRVLSWFVETIPVAPGSPFAVAVTPAGQRHEFGALLAAVVAAEEGWDVTYLGSDLPAADIAAAVEARSASIVLMSALFEETAISLVRELRELRLKAGREVDILVGGQGSRAYRGELDAAGATWLPDLNTLRAHLRKARVEADSA